MSRGLAKRPLKEICAERALIEILYADLSRKPRGDLVQKHGEESKGLRQRSFIQIA